MAEGGALLDAALPPAHVGRARFLPERTAPPDPGSRPPVLSSRSLARISLMPINNAAKK